MMTYNENSCEIFSTNEAFFFDEEKAQLLQVLLVETHFIRDSKSWEQSMHEPTQKSWTAIKLSKLKKPRSMRQGSILKEENVLHAAQTTRSNVLLPRMEVTCFGHSSTGVLFRKKYRI